MESICRAPLWLLGPRGNRKEGFASILPKDRLSELDRVQRHAATTAGAQEFETKRVHKDGHAIDVAIAVSPIHDKAGITIGISSRSRDIGERKRTDALMAEMAAIVDSSNDAIIGKTLQGVITTWNRGAEQIYGYTAPEMIGKNISLLVPRGRPDEIREIIASMLAGKVRSEHFETQRVRKDGTRNRDLGHSLADPQFRWDHHGASSVARDVTEHNAMAETLKAAELRSVLAVSRAKDEMVSARQSRELRTAACEPAGLHRSCSTCKISNAGAAKAVSRVGCLGEGRRLTDLINDVLHIQRLEAGHQEPRPRPRGPVGTH